MSCDNTQSSACALCGGEGCSWVTVRAVLSAPRIHIRSQEVYLAEKKRRYCANSYYKSQHSDTKCMLGIPGMTSTKFKVIFSLF